MDKIIRILILEDRESDAELMEFALMDAGLAFTIEWATNEETFLQGLEEFFPDLILSDYILPQYTGALAFREAKARYPYVPFILVVGSLDRYNDQIGNILAQGAFDCVLKDRLDLLAPAVCRALGLT